MAGLTNAAREGARAAIISGTTNADVTTRVRNYMQGGALPNYATATVTITSNVPLTGPDPPARGGDRLSVQFMVLQPVVRLVSPNATTGAPITCIRQP